MHSFKPWSTRLYLLDSRRLVWYTNVELIYKCHTQTWSCCVTRTRSAVLMHKNMKCVVCKTLRIQSVAAGSFRFGASQHQQKWNKSSSLFNLLVYSGRTLLTCWHGFILHEMYNKHICSADYHVSSWFEKAAVTLY